MQNWDSQDNEVVDRTEEGKCLVHGLSTDRVGRDITFEALYTSALLKDQEILILDITSPHDVMERWSRTGTCYLRTRAFRCPHTDNPHTYSIQGDGGKLLTPSINIGLQMVLRLHNSNILQGLNFIKIRQDTNNI